MEEGTGKVPGKKNNFSYSKEFTSLIGLHVIILLILKYFLTSKTNKLCKSAFLDNLKRQRSRSKGISPGKQWAYSSLLKNLGTSRSLRLTAGEILTDEATRKGLNT